MTELPRASKVLGLAGITVLLLGLGGCASTPPGVSEGSTAGRAQAAASANFELSARLSIRQDQKLDVVNIRWVRLADREELVLRSPLGSTVARLSRDSSGEAVLDEGRGSLRRAASIEALINEVLGQAVPLNALGWWVQGRQADGQALLPPGPFVHEGWTVRVERAEDGTVARLDGQNGDIRLRLVMDAWAAR